MGLSTRQKNLIEFMIDNPALPEYECAKQCGIARSTFYDWKKKPEFNEALEKRLKEIWNDSHRMAIETMTSLCREGDFKASKYILDNLGYAPTQKIQAEVTTDITINIEE